MRRKNPKKRTQYTIGKKLALQRLGVKRLSPTKTQRREAREQWKQIFGYYPAKLSEQVGKPSRYTRKGIRKITDAEGKVVREDFIVRRVSKGGRGKGGGGGERISHVTGTAAARKSTAKLGGTMGMRSKKEKRKKRKKR